MSSSKETAYVSLAQYVKPMGAVREVFLWILWYVGIGNTRADIVEILGQEPSLVMQTWLEKHEQVLGLLWKVGKDIEPANDSSSLAKAA
jgi:hypothetical protein